jgi:hypothetical protein
MCNRNPLSRDSVTDHVKAPTVNTPSGEQDVEPELPWSAQEKAGKRRPLEVDPLKTDEPRDKKGSNFEEIELAGSLENSAASLLAPR